MPSLMWVSTIRSHSISARCRVERLVVEMAGHPNVVEVALAHEQVGAVGRRSMQRVGPLGVARVGDHLAAVLDPRSAYDGAPLEWRTSNGVIRAGPKSRGRASRELDEVGLERALGVGGARVQAPRTFAGRARRRPAGPAIVSGFVRRANCPSRISQGRPAKWSPWRWLSAIEPESRSGRCPSLERDQRGRAAVEQQRLGAAVEVAGRPGSARRRRTRRRTRGR